MRYAKACHIGVMAPTFTTDYGYTNYEFIGVIRRSGRVLECGHFCYVEVSVNGTKHRAGGAEDRIYPFHSIKLDVDEKLPKLELRAIGWCKDGNTFAYMNKDLEIVTIDGKSIDIDNVKPITRSKESMRNTNHAWW